MAESSIVGRDDLIAEAVHALAGRGAILAGVRGSGRSRLLGACAARVATNPPQEVLVVDDLERLDDAGAANLRAQVLDGTHLLGALLTGSPCAEPITRLWRDDGVVRIDLPPLDRPAIAALAEIAAGAPVDGYAAQRLLELSGGLPADLVDLLDGAGEHGWFDTSDGIARLRPGIPDTPALAGRIAGLGRLAPGVRALVELVAVGRAVPRVITPALAPRDVEAGALASGYVVAESDRARSVLRPATPLIGELIRMRLSSDTQVHHRAALVAALVDATDDDEDHLRLRAESYLDAGLGTADQVKAVRDVVAAGLASGRSDVADLAERLWRATGETEDGLALALAFDHGGRPRQQLEVARDVARRATDDRITAVAVDRMVSALIRLGRESDAFRALDSALAAVGDPRAKGRLMIVRANRNLHAGRLGAALEQTEPLLALGVPVPEAALVAGVAHAVAGHRARAEELVAAGEAMLGAAEEGELVARLLPVARALALIQAGQPAEAEAAMLSAYSAAIALGDRPGQGWTALTLGRIELARGRAVRAVAFFRGSIVGFADFGEVGYVAWAQAGLAAALGLAGDLDAARHELARRESLPFQRLGLLEVESQRLLAIVERCCGDPDAARRRLLASEADAGDQLTCHAALLHDLARLGEPAAAAERLDPLRGSVETAGLYFAHATALAVGDAAALARVAESLENACAWLDAAETWAEAAAASVGERDRSHCRLRALSLAARCEGATTPVLAQLAPVRLSGRQLEVATLAAAGLSRPAIAQQLFLSDRTVDRHLSDAFIALGVRQLPDLPAALADLRAIHPSPSAATSPVAVDLWPLVGRTDEADTVRRAVADPSQHGALLHGPLGCGASRLAAGLQDELVGRGWTAVTVHGSASRSLTLGALAVEGDHPIALLIDDADRLVGDDSSLLAGVLTHLHGFALITASGRDLSARWQRPDVTDVPIGPLSSDAVHDLLLTVLGGPILASAAASFHAASGGNPLVLRELVRGCRRSGRLFERDGLWRLTGEIDVTPSLRDLVRAHLQTVHPELRAALEVLAVLGPVPEELVDVVLTPDGVAEGIAAGVIVRMGGAIALSQPVYADELRTSADVGTVVRLVLHLAAQAHIPIDPTRRATWSLLVGKDVPADVLETAATEALRLADHGPALRFARAAARAASSGASLLVANALAADGHTEEADDHLAGHASPGNPPVTRVRAALARSDMALWASTDPTAAASSLGDPSLGDGLDRDDPLRATLAAQRNLVAVIGRIAAPLSTAPPSRPVKDPRDLLLASGAALVAGRPVTASALAAEAANGVGDWYETMYLSSAVVSQWVSSLMHCGRPDEADAVIRARRPGGPRRPLVHPGPEHGWLELSRGRVAGAQLSFGDALEHAIARPGTELWCSARLGLSLAAAWAGDAAAAQAELDLAGEPMFAGLRVERARAHGWTLAAQGDRPAAIALLITAFERFERWPGLAISLSHDVVRLGGWQEAERLAGIAEATEGELAAARFAQGHAVADRDPVGLLIAAEQFGACGSLLFAAEAAFLASSWSRERGQRGPAARAETAGRRWLADCPGAATPGAAPRTTGLTARQYDIARLAADGVASREIADRLGLSVRTVDNQIQRIYDRLGIRRRSDLAKAIAGFMDAGP